MNNGSFFTEVSISNKKAQTFFQAGLRFRYRSSNYGAHAPSPRGFAVLVARLVSDYAV